MTQVSIEEVQKNISGYLDRVEAGEALVIVRAGKPIAELKPVKSAAEAELRPFGLCRGQFTVPDDFDEPLPEELLRAFEGK